MFVNFADNWYGDVRTIHSICKYNSNFPTPTFQIKLCVIERYNDHGQPQATPHFATFDNIEERDEEFQRMVDIISVNCNESL